MITTVLFDLDGVLRHFDPAVIAGIEGDHDLAPGSLLTAAFAEPGLGDVITGRITRTQWIAGIGAALACPVAADRWGSVAAVVDRAMVGLLDELRGLGLTTAILTNGTDTIPAELADCGLDRRVDAVFNSAEIGHAKPDRRAFAHVLEALGVRADEVLFTDDSPSKLTGAIGLGMITHAFVGIDPLRTALRAAGVPVAAPALSSGGADH